MYSDLSLLAFAGEIPFYYGNNYADLENEEYEHRDSLYNNKVYVGELTGTYLSTLSTLIVRRFSHDRSSNCKYNISLLKGRCRIPSVISIG